MPLHLTKVAYGCDNIDYLAGRLALKAAHQPAFLTTRYLPKRAAEITAEGAAGGSLFWIIKHKLIGRSPIIGFGEAEGGRVAIYLEPKLVLVHPIPKRAHQGWRYLEGENAPRDLGEGGDGAGDLPPSLLGELSAMGLV